MKESLPLYGFKFTIHFPISERLGYYDLQIYICKSISLCGWIEQAG